jgi:hypothetical protein
MNHILELSNKIDNENNINNKMKMINELNILIEKQKEYFNDLIIKINSSESIKINKTESCKYKNKSIEELEELFNNKSDIEEKINIYHVINKYYNDKLNELNN